MIETPKLQRIIEGALLASGKPVPMEKLQELFPETERPEVAQLEEALAALGEACADRGFELKKVSSGYRFQVKQELSEWVSRLWEEKPQKYSRAVLETLSIIAYRQPITRGDIEKIRGVAVSTQIVQTLLEHEWVRVVGYRDVPGRPAMYATTKQFLDYFNLSSLEELPALAEIRDLESVNRELSLEEDKPMGRIIEFPEPDPAQDQAVEDEEEAAAAAVGTRPISEILSEVDSKLAQGIRPEWEGGVVPDPDDESAAEDAGHEDAELQEGADDSEPQTAEPQAVADDSETQTAEPQAETDTGDESNNDEAAPQQ